MDLVESQSNELPLFCVHTSSLLSLSSSYSAYLIFQTGGGGAAGGGNNNDMEATVAAAVRNAFEDLARQQQAEAQQQQQQLPQQQQQRRQLPQVPQELVDPLTQVRLEDACWLCKGMLQ